jgi:hypothetical protein
VASATALFNEQGKGGYAYVGPFFVGSSSHELFVKAEAGATYTYEVIEKSVDTSTPSGLLARLKSKGSEGYVYKGAAFFGTDFTSSSLLFVKRNTKATTYSYRSGAWPTDEAATLSEFNANGAEGYAYIGDVIPDSAKPTTGMRLFVKDDSAAVTHSYLFKPQLVDSAQLLAEIGVQGREKANWKGGYVFGTGTPAMQTRTLYEKSSSTTTPISCSFTPPAPTTIDALVARANESAAKGEFYWGDYQVGTETIGVTCTALPRSLPLLGVVVP